MINQQGLVGSAYIRPIYGERWELSLFVPGSGPDGVHRLHAIPPCLRKKVAAIDIASDGITQGLGYRSLHPYLGGKYAYDVYLTRAEVDELVQYLRDR